MWDDSDTSSIAIQLSNNLVIQASEFNIVLTILNYVFENSLLLCKL